MRITGKIRAMVSTLGLTAVMLLAACGGDSGGGGTGTGKSNDQLLKDAAKNMRELKSYTVDVKGSSGGQSIAMKADLDVDDKKTMMEMTSPMSARIISLPDKTFMSTDGGQTFIDASAQGGMFTASLSGFTEIWTKMTDAEVDKVKSALKDGSPATESIDGTNTKHITGDMKSLSALSASTGGEASEGTVDMWITTDGTNYVRRMKLTGTTSGQAMDATIDWTNFNKEFDIKEPPVQ